MTRNDKIVRDPDRWGATVRVTAANFKAKNITFENSFNQIYTAEEVKDGVVPNGCQDITVDRVAQTVKADSKDATERGAAIALDGDDAELYNCSFVGSQDTFYTGKNAYVKNCDITGNTDYIFGGGNVVFDNCNLIWGGYSDSAVGGYITANKPSASGDSYVFRNCKIQNTTKEGRTCSGGAYGRDWGGLLASVYFLNCTVDEGVTVSGWSEMIGDDQPENQAIKLGKADLHVFDFSNPSAYTTYGTTDQYNITEITFDKARAKYEGVVAALGFTPEHLANAVTTTEVVNSDDGTAHGILTTLTQGSGATISGIKWTVTNGSTTKTFSTEKISPSVPTITGDGTATVLMMFDTAATTATYNVLSQVIE
ncbi:MAG: pectinesterase family protein, partial [Eubacterium sp.]